MYGPNHCDKIEDGTTSENAGTGTEPVIEQIHRVYPGLDIENLGETEFIVTYEKQKTPGKAVHFLKTVGVVMITFLGSAFSIMAFNNDVDVGKMFGQVYEQLTGVPSSGFTLLEVCYSIQHRWKWK